MIIYFFLESWRLRVKSYRFCFVGFQSVIIILMISVVLISLPHVSLLCTEFLQASPSMISCSGWSFADTVMRMATWTSTTTLAALWGWMPCVVSLSNRPNFWLHHTELVSHGCFICSVGCRETRLQCGGKKIKVAQTSLNSNFVYNFINCSPWITVLASNGIQVIWTFAIQGLSFCWILHKH